MDIDLYFMFGVLILCSAVVGYLGLKGRMDSRPVFILMPVATLGIAVMTLLVRTEGHVVLFLLVVSVMASVVLVLLGTLGWHLVSSNLRNRSERKDAARPTPPNDGAEL